MNFDFSTEQKMLKDEARKLLDAHCGIGRVRAVLDAPDAGYDADLWKLIAQQGWLAAAIPEAFGGLGLGRLELCVLAEELGRALAPVPFASTVYLLAEAVMLAGTDAQQACWLPGLASGATIGCLAVAEGPGMLAPEAVAVAVTDGRISGVKTAVVDGAVATVALVLARERDGIGLFLVDLAREGIDRAPLTTLDPTRGAATLSFREAPAERLGAPGAGVAILEQLMDRAAVMFAFEQCGGADRCLELACDQALSRYAFGRPIGSFQAIKHKLADVYVDNELARSNAYYGAWAVDTAAAELPVAAAAARISASRAYWHAASESVQVHGGIGYTWAADCHLHYRRSRHLSLAAGAVAIWKERLVSRLESQVAQ